MTDGNPFSRFSHGFLHPFHAVGFLWRHPGLWRYILVPFLINLLVFSAAVFFGLDLFNDLVLARIPRGEAWFWSVFFYLLWLAGMVLTAILVFFTFTVFGNLIASPFNDLLSERTEELLRGHRLEERFSWRTLVGDVGRSLYQEVRRISFFLAAMAILLLLNLLPVVGTVLYAPSAFLLTLFFLVVEYTGYVFGRKRATFQAQRQFIMGRKPLMLGFGAGVLTVLAIPLLQFFCIPVAVIAATRLWFDQAGGAAHLEAGDQGGRR